MTTSQESLLHEECEYHLDNAGGTCTGCGERIDPYGNTAYAFKYCSFPNCGCDGARLCMAGEASESAQSGNVEGMWSGKTVEQRKAVFDLLETVHKERVK
jgi:hypothetical protein